MPMEDVCPSLKLHGVGLHAYPDLFYHTLYTDTALSEAGPLRCIYIVTGRDGEVVQGIGVPPGRL